MSSRTYGKTLRATERLVAEKAITTPRRPRHRAPTMNYEVGLRNGLYDLEDLPTRIG